MQYYRFFLRTLVLLFSISLSGQQQEILFPELSGDALIQKLRANYKTSVVLSYEEARETMYTSIWNTDDSVVCVYTGHSLYLPPDEDNPIFFLSMLGSLNGIITEHTYPRSKGAEEGNGLSDMHHLVPARLGANIARNNFPFGEIPDEETFLWLYKTESLNDIPSENIDLYSEQRIGEFEPREDFKGNIARSVFYFYTMYHEEAMAADPDFFDQQQSDLCQWHYLDPVDEQEWNRSFEVAQYQEEMPNPFILDCTLPFRTYCSDVPNQCVVSSTSRQLTSADYQFQVFPNPVTSHTVISFSMEDAKVVQLEVYDLLGRKLLQIAGGEHQPGQYEYDLSGLDNTSAGLLICRMLIMDKGEVIQLDRKVIIR